ncbi:MAG TPA: MerR family transcriptional regulator [Acidimicrobiia bacterium]
MARPQGMTIEELARRAGVSTRNVRAYRTAGLLPPPRLEGRTGRYDDAHLRRLDVVARLQRRGWSLAAIGDALEASDAGGTLADVLGLAAPARRDWVEELFDDHPHVAADAMLPHGVWN